MPLTPADRAPASRVRLKRLRLIRVLFGVFLPAMILWGSRSVSEPLEGRVYIFCANALLKMAYRFATWPARVVPAHGKAVTFSCKGSPGSGGPTMARAKESRAHHFFSKFFKGNGEYFHN